MRSSARSRSATGRPAGSGASPAPRVADRMVTARVDDTVTAALRSHDSSILVDGFGAHVSRLRDQASWDSRDEMLSLAAFFDCARRLGEDPAELLGASSRGAPDWFVQTFDP